MGPFRNLGFAAYFAKASNAVAAGTTNVNCSSYDLVGTFGGPYDCICAICNLNALTASQNTQLKLQGSTDNSTWNDIANSHQGPPLDNQSNTLLIVDAFRPQYRYIRPVVTRGTANAAIDCVDVIMYNAHSLPVTTQDSTVATVANNGTGMAYGGLYGNNTAAPLPVNVIPYQTNGTA